MQFPQMLLVFSTLITLVITLPTGVKNENNTDLLQDVSKTLLDYSGNKSLFFLVEERKPNSRPVIMEFIYNRNRNADSIVSDKDRYMIGFEPLEVRNDNKINLEGKVSINETLKSKSNREETTEPAKNLETEVYLKHEATSLIPQEASPLLGNWPKYFYDAFNPIQPFPEMHYKKLNTIQVEKEQNIPAALPYAKEQRRIQDTAGPQLNPSSIYDREFRQTMFDF